MSVVASVQTAEPTLADVFNSIWAAKRAIIFGGILGLLAAFVFMAVAVSHYRVTMMIAPSDRAPKADIKALLPDNPSFALQYLVNSVGSQDSSDFIRFENMLRGPSVAKALLADEKITGKLAKNGRFVFSGRDNVSSAQALSDLLNKKMAIETVGNTPLRRVVFDAADAEFGVYLLNQVYARADALIRSEVDGQAEARAAYLQGMLGKVSNPDHRRALTALLMEQEHIRMILGANEPYAAIIAEPPSVSVKPYWPRKSLIVAGFIFAGMIAGFAFWCLGRKN
jgi:uncharacterized protein involved in exopolysaccharide biosynthesis